MIKVIPNMEKLKNVLQSKDLKPTFQRLKILGYLNQHPDEHPTVEHIHEALARKIPTISMTTVYNTLSAFLNKGIVEAVTITGTEIRYDIKTKHHHHFLCKRCGHILDIEIKCPLTEKNTIQGNKIDEWHGYLKGICKDCLKKPG
jgi:Fe2+ or Zn2+ uptake regulation protein